MSSQQQLLVDTEEETTAKNANANANATYETTEHDAETETSSVPPNPSDDDDDDDDASSSCYRRAALALHRADYLLILAGAGMSADSGLKTYETMPERYKELCDPSRLLCLSLSLSLASREEVCRCRREFQQFWYDFAVTYATTRPHEGYRILDGWCHGGKLKRLSSSSSSSSSQEQEQEQRWSSTTVAHTHPDLADTHKWWVYTSNVDGHFHRYPSFRRGGEHGDDDDNDNDNDNDNNVCEIHGHAGRFRCSSGIGYADGGGRQQRRLGAVWDRWNDRVEAVRTDRCSSATTPAEDLDWVPQQQQQQQQQQQNDGGEIEGEIDEGDTQQQQQQHPMLLLLSCPTCRRRADSEQQDDNDMSPLPLRPNVLLFHDTDENVLGPIRRQRARYQDWEALVEDRVAHHGKRLVLLELGCGTSVPAVRQESRDVVGDVLQLVKHGNINNNNNGDGDGDGDGNINGNGNGNGGSAVTLIRINPRDAGWDGKENDDEASSCLVSIFDTSLRALERIDRELDALLLLDESRAEQSKAKQIRCDRVR
eukprot:jgi/Psemu1/26570/gm1.26570_g